MFLRQRTAGYLAHWKIDVEPLVRELLIPMDATLNRRAFLTGLVGSTLLCAEMIPSARAFSSALPTGDSPEKGRIQETVSVFDFLDEKAQAAVLNNDYSSLTGVSAFVQRAIDEAWGRVVIFGSGVFRLESAIRLPEECHLDLGVAKIQIVGDTLGFVSRPVANFRVLAVKDGANLGSRGLVVEEAAGIQPGQWAYLRGDSPEGNRNCRPPAWGIIEEIRGNTVVFDRALQVDYRGTCQLVIVPKLHRRFSLRNGVIDGSLNLYDQATGQGVRVTGYESVVIENVEFTHFDHRGTLTSALQVFECLDISVRHCSFKYGVSANNMVDLQTARHVEFLGNLISGDHFGVNITRADYGKAVGNTVVGRRKKNAELGDRKKRSVRGIKFYGCGHALISQNHCADFESPVKVEACARFIVEHNHVIISGLDVPAGQIALNIGSQNRDKDMHSGVVNGNIVENCGGTGIGITSDRMGRVIISNNVVRRCGAHGIYIAVDNCIITNNQISDWDLIGNGHAGIAATTFGSQIVKSNFFHNEHSRESRCIEINGPHSLVSDNLCSTQNPL